MAKGGYLGGSTIVRMYGQKNQRKKLVGALEIEAAVFAGESVESLLIGKRTAASIKTILKKKKPKK